MQKNFNANLGNILDLSKISKNVFLRFLNYVLYTNNAFNIYLLFYFLYSSVFFYINLYLYLYPYFLITFFFFSTTFGISNSTSIFSFTSLQLFLLSKSFTTNKSLNLKPIKSTEPFLLFST